MINIFTKLYTTLRDVAKHPLCRQSPWEARRKYCMGQFCSRMLGTEVCAPFPNEFRLLVSPRIKGEANFIYPPLVEFAEMGFVLHYLRPEDLFGDVGANIGAFTVLASGAVGARTVAFEPSPSTFRRLNINIRLNGLLEKVTSVNAAVGRADGSTEFTEGLGTENCVVPKDYCGNKSLVPVVKLDRFFSAEIPKLLKIDVEGFETEVLAGAPQLLHHPSLRAMIVERSHNGTRYGFDEGRLHSTIREAGFAPCSYDPLTRAFSPLADGAVGNIIYLRSTEEAAKVVREAPQFRVANCTI